MSFSPRHAIMVLAGLVLAAPVWSQSGTVSPSSPSKWAPITIDFNGPQSDESDSGPNPFLDFRMDLTLISPSGKSMVVPGFFDGDGLGRGSGKVWRARFSADEVGTWSYEAAFVSGSNIAVSGATGSPTGFHGAKGSFSVSGIRPDAKGFLKKGRLEYVGKHYLKFRDGGYWIKGGVNSPENFFGYRGFDNTFDRDNVDSGGFCKVDDSSLIDGLHSFAGHVGDATSSDPYFTSEEHKVDSRGITGAFNYLGAQELNSIFVMPLNLGGDACDTYPFIQAAKTAQNKRHYDVSKLHQWNMVVNHAQELGVQIQFVFAEAENQNKNWLDDGKLDIERKLFYREMIARFTYVMGIKWNLMEETEYSTNKITSFAGYIADLDWANHPVTVHTKRISDASDNSLDLYEPLYGDELFAASSLQLDQSGASDVIEKVREESAAMGQPWVADLDEVTFGVNPTPEAMNTLRKTTLYDVYFSGGNIEWYTKGADQTLEDFRILEDMWAYTRYARNFMLDHLPFWDMEPNDELLTGESNAFGGGEVFFKPNTVYAIYLPDASDTGEINLSSLNRDGFLRWFNPRTGAFTGATTSIPGGAKVALGAPPSSPGEDWVALVTASSTLPIELSAFGATADGDNIVVRWSTDQEVNNVGFDVEHRPVNSTRPFESLGFIEGAGTTDTPQDYVFVAQNIIAGTHQFRLRQTDQDGTIWYSDAIEVAASLPDKFKLTRAYPNPFNPSTRFSLVVGQSQHVAVTVRNALGASVKTLHNGAANSDLQYDFVFDADGLSSGVYFVSVSAETFQTSFPIVLTK